MPELSRRCQTLAAELVLGEADPAALRACIDAAVDAGFMSPHVLDALSAPKPYVLEPLLPAFKDLMRDQGLKGLDRSQACWLAAEGRLRAIASGEVDALEAVGAAVALASWNQDLFPDCEYAGDGMDMARLLGLWTCIGDLADMQHPVFDGQEGNAAWAALRQQIVEAARAWLQRNAGRVRPAPSP